MAHSRKNLRVERSLYVYAYDWASGAYVFSYSLDFPGVTFSELCALRRNLQSLFDRSTSRMEVFLSFVGKNASIALTDPELPF